MDEEKEVIRILDEIIETYYGHRGYDRGDPDRASYR